MISKAVIAASMLLTTISAAYAQQGHEPIVAIDYWWLKDYAKSGCLPGYTEGNPDRATACEDADSIVNDFEAKLIGQFSANPNCQGVTFAPIGNPLQSSAATAKAVANRDWDLIIDFGLSEKAIAQDWTLMSKDRTVVLKGSGHVERIASDVCSIIAHRGGNVVAQ